MNTKRVYSTDQGRICTECNNPVTNCRCKAKKLVAASDGIIRIRRETKGRGGKTVTTITGLPLLGEPLKELASALKKRCGCGGGVKDGVIEIQGEHVEFHQAKLN